MANAMKANPKSCFQSGVATHGFVFYLDEVRVIDIQTEHVLSLA